MNTHLRFAAPSFAKPFHRRKGAVVALNCLLAAAIAGLPACGGGGGDDASASAAAAASQSDADSWTVAFVRNQLDSETPVAEDAPSVTAMTLPSGQSAVVDHSLLHRGVVSAATPSSVELAWERPPSVLGYTISRDGEVIAQLDAEATRFKDTTVTAGQIYRYYIVPSLPATGEEGEQVWSMNVQVPPAADGEKSLASAAQAISASAAAARTTTVTWVTFIPMARVDAPPVGCDYGSGYQFGGDGRSYDWTSNKYRTALNAVVDWNNKSVASYPSIGATTVYNKRSGRLVATKTASASQVYAKKMGAGANDIDVRMVTHASNPFCHLGAIDGALSINLTRGGNYVIFSGNHRQMPNHHVYIYNAGKVTDVYRRNYAGAACLLGSAACELARFYGAGTF